MSKQIKQIRYYGEGNKNNYPTNLSRRHLISGTVFSKYVPMLKLRIEAPSKTKFYLNGSSNSVIVNKEGIFELDVDGFSHINALQFDAASLSEDIEIIVNIIYES